jgi:bile acid:Na+ symporter, BASS family
MSASQWLGLIVQASIMLTVLGLGLTATWEDATYLMRRPRLLLRAVLSMNVVMPIIAALIATTFAVRFEVKAALVALSVSPVPPIIQKKQITAGGREKYVVGLLVAMSLLAVVLVPLTVLILDRVFDRSAAISPAAVAKIMLMTVLAPLVAGLLIRHWFPRAAGASNAIIAIAGILLVLSVAVLLYGLWPIIRSYLGNGLVLMLAILAILGLAVGHLLGGPLAGDRTSLALSTASRHPAVALAIATSGILSDPKPELAIILLYLVVATIVSFPYQKWREARGKI